MSDDATGATVEFTFPFDEMSHVASRVVHALQMLAELVPYTDTDRLPPVVRIACLEDWFTNHRMLIEFLLIGTPRNCASAQDFVPDWKPKTSAETDRLRADYGFASEHVSHIGMPKRGAPLQNVSPEILRVKAAFVIDIAQEFVEALQDNGHRLSDMIQFGVQQARQLLDGTA